ncbi:Hypothetical protein RMP42_05860 (plasmid) [Roseomonas mucosa]|nr:Hypothetical protein RMP42_05860 [Roseomonas mucosa]
MTETSGSQLACYVDNPTQGVIATPPLLRGYRPDLYAVEHGTRRVLLGEAKTPGDIDNRHTRSQLAVYFEYLLHQVPGELWVAVPLTSAGTALRVCRSVRSRLGAPHVPLVITGWLLGAKPFVEVWRG